MENNADDKRLEVIMEGVIIQVLSLFSCHAVCTQCLWTPLQYISRLCSISKPGSHSHYFVSFLSTHHHGDGGPIHSLCCELMSLHIPINKRMIVENSPSSYDTIGCEMHYPPVHNPITLPHHLITCNHFFIDLV